MKYAFTHILTLIFICTFCLSSCQKDFDMIPSTVYKGDMPKNVQLLDHTSKTLTIAWDFIPEATSYTVQILATPDDEMPLYTYTTTHEDYYEFSNLSSRTSYYARVRANFPYSSVSDWVYVKKDDQIGKMIPLYGLVNNNFEIPYIKIIDSSASTLTFEWSFTGFEDTDNETGDTYALQLFKDAEGKELFISWDEVSGLFAPSTASTSKPLRFTFSGLQPSKDYFLKVKNITKNMESSIRKVSTVNALAAAVSAPTKSGDIILSQDFSKFIHGGDIFHKAAGYTVSTAAGRAALKPASGANPVDEELGQGLCDLNTEFNVFDGGNVTRSYTEALGMGDWGKQGNTSTRPGYIKIGGSKGLAALYSPILSTLPGNSSITIKFKAGVYKEGEISSADNIFVQAVEGAKFSSKGAILNPNDVTILQSIAVNIVEAKDQFKEYTVTLNNVSKVARIAFSSDPTQISANKTRFLLDDIIMVIK
ncbi:MAG TPA: fibronectin type III domain-containing protein [Arachidicoccus sp.]|nr:fibronectin type III domain-containing protein [Arachidicoccus sp.]